MLARETEEKLQRIYQIAKSNSIFFGSLTGNVGGGDQGDINLMSYYLLTICLTALRAIE
jgi:hypothetical protein